MSNAFEKRGKLNLTTNDAIRGDESKSVISKDSNPREDEEHEEYYQEQDIKNMTSKLLDKNQALLN